MRTSSTPDRRIPALDGFRGLMTILVIGSHYFGEINGGLTQVRFGFVAVDGFFVLSGLLVGRLIIEKGHADNFFKIFYARRALRTFPIYFICVTLSIFASIPLGMEISPAVPSWSYLAFVNNVFMAARDVVGTEWLGPTWTMAVEEQFYLVAPLLMLLTPRRWLTFALFCVVLSAIALRTAMAMRNIDGIASVALLPTRADNLVIGLVCAPLLATSIDWKGTICRTLPIVLLFLIVGLRTAIGPGFFGLVGHTILCGAIAMFLMGLVRGAPEARRLEGRVLAFFGTTSYAVYLTHLPILWFVHRLVLGAEPSLSSPAGTILTVACIPVTVATAAGLTYFVEMPITAFGRRLHWRFSSSGGDGSSAHASESGVMARAPLRLPLKRSFDPSV